MGLNVPETEETKEWNILAGKPRWRLAQRQENNTALRKGLIVGGVFILPEPNRLAQLTQEDW